MTKSIPMQLLASDRSKHKEIAVQRLTEGKLLLTEKQLNYLEQTVPDKLKKTFVDSFNGSKSKAIRAKCLSCTNFSKEDITECTVQTCPLYSVCPYQTNDEGEE